MRTHVIRAVALLLLLPLTCAAAQSSDDAGSSADDAIYLWADASLTLAVPEGWDEPYAETRQSLLTLDLAATLASVPDRPPGIPAIRLTLFLDATLVPDAEAGLLRSLELLGTPADPAEPPAEVEFFGQPGLRASGSSADGLLVGVAQLAGLPDGTVLLMTGRAAADVQADFLQLYDAVAASLAYAEDGAADGSPAPLAFGVVWYTSTTLADGERAFVEPAGLALDPQTQRLYTADALAGVVQLDAVTGAVLALTPFEDPALPADVAVGVDGTVYVADLLCGCVRVLGADGMWAANVGEGSFGADAPRSLAVDAAGNVYASDATDSGAVLRVFNPAGAAREISVSTPSFTPPLLTTDPQGDLLLLTLEGDLLRYADGAVNAAAESLALPPTVTDFALYDDLLVIATEDAGVLLLTFAGEERGRVGRVVANFPLPGEFVRPVGVAVDAEGTVFVVDSDGSFGAVAAMNTAVESGRIGSTQLVPGVAVQGVLNVGSPTQRWLLQGTAGQRVTITAVDSSGAGQLDLALRLIGPDGSEIAFNDDHNSSALLNPFDAQLAGAALPLDGTYVVIVELVQGEGAYTLGVSTPQVLQLDAAGTGTANGSLSAVFPAQVWQFSGTAGQVITITLRSAGVGTLDPLVRLYAPDGTLLDENDDAFDAALGRDAQLVSVRLPQDGVYSIEATRFDGSGQYSLTIVSTGTGP